MAHWSGSAYIANASLIVSFIYLGSILMWAVGGGGMEWRFASLDLLALFYFYRRWSSPEAQHRQFHFLLMCSYLTSTAFFAYQLAVASLAAHAVAMSPWWFKLFSNILFGLELILIMVYALLFRRAKSDTHKWRTDVENWFASVASARRALVDFIRHKLLRTHKQ